MRILIASWIALTACSGDPKVEVSFELPDGANIDDKSVRITIGEETAQGFGTVVGTGGPASAGSFVLTVPEGEDRRARVLIYQGDFVAVLHGISDPFDVVNGDDPISVNVPLGLPPEGIVTRAIPSRGAVLLEMQARRWSSVRIGVLPRQPTHEGLRPSSEPESDTLEEFSLEYPLDMIACALEQGCPITLFVDFVAADGVAGGTATATVAVDVVPPRLATRTRVEGATAVGASSRLIVSVDASEPISDVLLTLEREVTGTGQCAERIGPYGCTGADRKFTCIAEAPDQPCDASYSIAVQAADSAGNQANVSGASIAIDNIPPQLTVSSVECAAGILVASGSATEAAQVSLQDAGGAWLASVEGGSFELAASSSIAASVVATDLGGNETSRPVSCP